MPQAPEKQVGASIGDEAVSHARSDFPKKEKELSQIAICFTCDEV
jgi:hypothetical protein